MVRYPENWTTAVVAQIALITACFWTALSGSLQLSAKANLFSRMLPPHSLKSKNSILAPKHQEQHILPLKNG
jgi:hypothetical protein